MMKKVLLALAAASMVATPVLAQPAPAAQAPAPAAEHVDGNQIRGGFIIPLVLVAAAILAVLAATHNFPFKRHPVSP